MPELIPCKHIFSNGSEFEWFIETQCEKCKRLRNGKCRICFGIAENFCNFAGLLSCSRSVRNKHNFWFKLSAGRMIHSTIRAFQRQFIAIIYALVVTEKAEPEKCENCFWYCRTCHNKESAFYGDVMGKSGYCVHHDYKSEETNMNPEQPAHDAVSHPSHYCKGGVECLDAIKAALGDKYEGFLAGNVLKYVYRYPDKNGVEDCKKARFYLDKLIEVLSDEER